MLQPELLLQIISYLHPNCLPPLASTSRTIRSTIDPLLTIPFATKHLAITGYGDLQRISFDHPLLAPYALAVISRLGLSLTAVEQMWGENAHLISGNSPKTCRRAEVLALALRSGVVHPAGSRLYREEMFPLAARWHSLELLDALRSAYLNQEPDHFSTAFMRSFLVSAAENGFTEGLALIPPHHEVLSSVTESGLTLLHYAVKSSYHAVVVLLEKGAPANPAVEATHVVGTPLHVAAAAADGGAPAMVELLLSHGASVTALDPDGETPLHVAAENGNDEALRIMLKFHGRDSIEIPSRIDAATPLFRACLNGRLSTAKLLHDEGGARLDARGVGGVWGVWGRPAEGTSVLHVAVKSRNVELVRWLVGVGAEVSARDANGVTPLHVAWKLNRPGMASVLVEAGADIRARCCHGMTPMHGVARVRPGVDGAMVERSWEVLKRMLERGGDPNAKNAKGRTMLHAAAEVGNGEMVLWLVKRKGVELNARDDEGNTWMHLAMEGGKEEWLKKHWDMWLRSGVEVAARNSKGISCAEVLEMPCRLINSDQKADGLIKSRVRMLASG
ncbi:B-cell lymphoma 3 protein [Phlyctochytrium bullatum]|nr:B-cell lymphoma 3 protein [Phlyctochytrium bullatum]